jgi:hypothetical protein
VLLLRRLNIPCRYAVGYAVHEGSEGKFVVRQRDAHAWCLVWDEKHNIWRDVDFTPPIWVQVEHGGHGRLQAISDFFARVRFELAKLRWGQTHLRQYLLWAVLPVLLILLYQIVFHSRKHRKKSTPSEARRVAWPGLDSEFYRVEQVLAEQGLMRLPSEPLAVWLERCSQNALNPELKALLHQLLALHNRYRFDPQGLTAGERDGLRLQTSACLQKLKPS